MAGSTCSNSLIDAIEADDAAAGPADTTIILLGDLVDRGPDSARVIARAREWQRQRKVRILAGNHEEMFLKSFDNEDTLRHFLRFGGRETVLSYGIDRSVYNAAEIEHVQAADERRRAAGGPRLHRRVRRPDRHRRLCVRPCRDPAGNAVRTAGAQAPAGGSASRFCRTPNRTARWSSTATRFATNPKTAATASVSIPAPITAAG